MLRLPLPQRSRPGHCLLPHKGLLPSAALLQVSCFGDDRQTDSGDVWRVEWDNASMAHWRRDAPVRLVHKDTGSYLSTHAIKYQRCAGAVQQCNRMPAGSSAVATVPPGRGAHARGCRVLLRLTWDRLLRARRPIPGHTEVMAMKTKVNRGGVAVRVGLRFLYAGP